MHRWEKAVLLGIATLLASAPLAVATQVIYRSPQQLGTDSELVVRGTVESVRSSWNAKGTKIFTTTRIAVDELFKGQAGGTVEIVQLGGVVDNVRVTVAGALHWTPGEEVVLFLEPYQGGRYHVAGFSQGKFNIERDPVSGEEFIRRPAMDGVELVGAPDGTPRAMVTRKLSVEEFVSQALGRK